MREKERKRHRRGGSKRHRNRGDVTYQKCIHCWSTVHSAVGGRKDGAGPERLEGCVWWGQALHLFVPSRVKSPAGLFREVLCITTGTSHSPGSMIFIPFFPPPDLVSLLSLLSWGVSPQGPGFGLELSLLYPYHLE